jgi:hypothetical protein
MYIALIDETVSWLLSGVLVPCMPFRAPVVIVPVCSPPFSWGVDVGECRKEPCTAHVNLRRDALS